MDRRDVLLNIGTLAVASSGVFSIGSTEAFSAAASPIENLIATSVKCLEMGLKCERLCTETLIKGDKMMADCMLAIQDMLTMVRATSELAAHKSPLLTKMVASCSLACEECKKQCEKHAKHHAICADCAQACDECMKACQKISA